MVEQKINVVFVSGLSGAGKTVVLRALEDIGFFCIDNLPLPLVRPFLELVNSRGNIFTVGIGADIREKGFISNSYSIFTSLKTEYRLEIVFIEADHDVIVRRYRETRRPHPMAAPEAQISLDEAIEKEKDALKEIREAADRIIDTTHLNPHQLRNHVSALFRENPGENVMNLTILSFGHKYGVPSNADIIFDVRFLPNPYFVPSLKDFRGTDPEVAAFVLGNSEATGFLSHVESMLGFLIPRYRAEGKTYLVIGFGCTGGKHRSPAIAERVAGFVRDSFGIHALAVHRDMQ